MSAWSPLNTAPRDGRLIEVQTSFGIEARAQCSATTGLWLIHTGDRERCYLARERDLKGWRPCKV